MIKTEAPARRAETNTIAFSLWGALVNLLYDPYKSDEKTRLAKPRTPK